MVESLQAVEQAVHHIMYFMVAAAIAIPVVAGMWCLIIRRYL